MRRLAVVFGLSALVVLTISSPAAAFAHDRVQNPIAHTLLDLLTLAVVTAPLWTAYLWGGRRRGVLIGLVAIVQLPVALVGFVPLVDPTVHAVALLGALVLTGCSFWASRPPVGRHTLTAPSPHPKSGT